MRVDDYKVSLTFNKQEVSDTTILKTEFTKPVSKKQAFHFHKRIWAVSGLCMCAFGSTFC